MSKYYTPDIKEFKVGFEYEIHLTKLDGRWSQMKIEDRSDLIEALEDAPDYTYRVKYLDKQDIESCGFDENGWNKQKEIRVAINKKGLIKIQKRNNFNKSLFIVFFGTIKNLSELKMILDMLNIAYRNMK